MTAGNEEYSIRLGPGSVDEIARTVIGRRRECEVVVAALMSGRHLLLEGPPGTGKSTILRSLAAAVGIEMEFVEGNADLTPARLVGHFDPAQVLEQGYRDQIWIDGPLASSIRHGKLLYLEEINRIPEETLNLLVTVMAEQELTIPRLGRIAAEPEFRLVAAMNPYDSIGTARISGAIYDRVCRLTIDYQDAEDEVAITRRCSGDVVSLLISQVAVAAVRALREHHEVRIGPSVRGAIDLVVLADSLATVRSTSVDGYELGLDAALVALSGRLQLHDSIGTSPEHIVSEVWAEIWSQFHPGPGADDGADNNASDSGSIDGNGRGDTDNTDKTLEPGEKEPGRRAADHSSVNTN